MIANQIQLIQGHQNWSDNLSQDNLGQEKNTLQTQRISVTLEDGIQKGL